MLLVNSRPLSVKTICGTPKIPHHDYISAFFTVSAFLSDKGAVTKNPVPLSLIVIMYLLLSEITFIGPMKSK